MHTKPLRWLTVVVIFGCITQVFAAPPRRPPALDGPDGNRPSLDPVHDQDPVHDPPHRVDPVHDPRPGPDQRRDPPSRPEPKRTSPRKPDRPVAPRVERPRRHKTSHHDPARDVLLGLFVGGALEALLQPPAPPTFKPVPPASVAPVPARPVRARRPATPGIEIRTAWITNPNGSRTQVRLRSALGGQWVGPRGEYYATFPTEDQLLALYGIQTDAEPSATGAAAVVEAPKTIWVTNSNGSKTPVELKPAGGGQWMGPKGEVYEELPTEDQLRETYGF